MLEAVELSGSNFWEKLYKIIVKFFFFSFLPKVTSKTIKSFFIRCNKKYRNCQKIIASFKLLNLKWFLNTSYNIKITKNCLIAIS